MCTRDQPLPVHPALIKYKYIVRNSNWQCTSAGRGRVEAPTFKFDNGMINEL